MDPVQQARLNPTATNVYIPQEGIFRSTAGDPVIYKRVGNELQTFDLTSLLSEQERQQLGNYGAQSQEALRRFQSQYGLDFNTISQANIGDLFQSLARQGVGYTNPEGSYIAPIKRSSNINDFLNQQMAQMQTQTINAQPNKLAPGTEQSPNANVVQPSQQPQGNALPVDQSVVNPNAPQGPGGLQGAVQTPQQQNQAAATPPSQPAQTYTIQSGDTLSKLAAQYGTTVGALMSLNPQITDANRIYAGQKINLTPSQVSNTQGIQAGLNAATLQAQAIQQQISSMTSPTSSADPITPTTANGQTPTSNFMETYSKVAKELGLSDIKSAYTKVLDESKELEDKKNDEAQKINNNPWYSQGKRQLELQKLDKKYETKLNTLSNYAKLYDSLYQEGIANAEFLTTGIQREQQFALELAQKKEEAVNELLKDANKLQSGIVGEYQFAVQNGYEGTFSQYQNEDANRKAVIARAGATVMPTTQDINTKETSEALGTVNQISEILSDANFDKSFGALGLARTLIPGTPEYTLGAKVQQIKDKLSLAARGQLKGQGQVSNYEGLMLANAQTNLRTGMNPADARQEFINIQGALTTSTGGKAKVQLKDKSGAVYTVMADSRGITQAIADGLSVKYVQ